MNDEQIDLQDKMGQAHRDMLRRMLGVNELPLAVLKRYFSLKKSLDKIDGFLSPSDLLRIALDCGFNPETGRFEKQVSPTGYDTNAKLVKLGVLGEEPDRQEKVRVNSNKPGARELEDEINSAEPGEAVKSPASITPKDIVREEVAEDEAKAVTKPEENAEFAQPAEAEVVEYDPEADRREQAKIDAVIGEETALPESDTTFSGEPVAETEETAEPISKREVAEPGLVDEDTIIPSLEKVQAEIAEENSETVTASSSEAPEEPEVAETEEDDDEPTEPLTVGQSVHAFVDGNIIDGKINGSKEGEPGEILYSIDTGDEVIDDVTINDIEVI